MSMSWPYVVIAAIVQAPATGGSGLVLDLTMPKTLSSAQVRQIGEWLSGLQGTELVQTSVNRHFASGACNSSTTESWYAGTSLAGTGFTLMKLHDN